MSSKKRKTTSKYSNPDEAPITYGGNEEGETKEVETLVEQESVETNVVDTETPVEKTPSDEPKNVEKTPKVKEKTEPKQVQRAETNIPETVFTNFIRVRIVGIHRLAGYRTMSPLGVANLVVENTSGNYSVITSSKTAKLICKIIRECRGNLRVKNLSDERCELLIARFYKDMERFKF